MAQKAQLSPFPTFFNNPTHLPSNANITVHLIDGGRHVGCFEAFNREERCVVMTGSDGVIIRVPLAHLCYLVFSEPFELSADQRKASVVLEDYQIVFRDGQTLAGKTYTHNIDEYGVHLYNAVANSRVEYCFVSIESINDYSFGTLQSSANGGTHTASVPSKLMPYHSKRTLIGALNQLSNYIDPESIQLTNQRIGEILVSEKVIGREALQEALKLQKKHPERKLGMIIESMGLISTEQINQKIAEKLGVPLVTLKHFDVDFESLNILPPDFCKRHRLMPLFEYKDHLVVALDDPLNFEAIDLVRFISAKSVESVLATRKDLEQAIEKYYGGERNIDDGLTLAEADAKINAYENSDLKEVERLAKEKPIVRMVGGVLSDAIHKKASDIHIRPLDNDVQLLYRIDGSLIQIRTFSRNLLPAIISRIKILGRMDVAERRMPQDGRARVSEQGGLVDLRISIIPTINGESAVIRLLNTKIGLRSIEELGLGYEDQERLHDLLHKNYGMFLVTGPTGSGKSTTLYAALQGIKSQNVNIITVEDPVEYQISGIEQIQVQPNLGYTFAESLRHILRHDPDVIMVGEIRDVETAKIAVECALTGHLMLSSLHTNSAAGTVTRLLEMGVEPFLVSSTLLGVLAQRLVRKNCVHCMTIESVSSAMRRSLDISQHEVFYKGKGCENCHYTGYSGRMAVYELITMSSNLRALVEKAKSTDAILQQAIREGMVTLTKNALLQARAKKTSLEEVYRVRLD